MPGFTDESAEGCDCAGCGAARAAARARRGGGPGGLRGVRCAVLATVGAVAFTGLGAAPAAAVTAPSHAGWDGSRYWFRNAAGEWRWTSHREVYAQRTGGAKSTPPARGHAGGSGGEPVFRGRQGWDARDRVYWFKSGGHWYWTSHRWKYEQRTGATRGGPGGGGAPAPVR
ncbi:hypothetical protein AB6O49_30605 [Streptomyces sp. SBR177]